MKSQKTPQRPNVEHFHSSAELLGAWFEYCKHTRQSFTFQRLSLDSELSVGLTNMLVNGKKPLKPKHVRPLAEALGMRPREIEYLTKLVHLENAANSEERAETLRRLARRGSFREHFQIEQGQIEYFSRWHIGVILALVDHPEFQPDERWIHETLLPSVSPKEIRMALDVLIDLRLVDISEDGRWRRKQATIDTPDEFSSEILKSYHYQRLELAKWGLENLSSDERNFGGITAFIDEKTFIKVREHMHEIRRELVDILNAAPVDRPDRVVLINWQTLVVARSKPPGEASDD